MVPTGYLVEDQKYEIEASCYGRELPSEWEVLLNDIPVDKVSRRGKAIYPFEVDFYAGDLRVAVSNGSKMVASVDLEIDPSVAKISRDEYAAMISDIARSTLALYRLGNLTLPADINPTGVRSDVVTLDLIRSNIDSFENAVRRIANQPLRSLHSHRVSTDILKAKRVDDKALGMVMRSGRHRAATQAERRAAPRIVAALGGNWAPEITEPRSKEGANCFENRALLGFIRWLDRTLADTSKRLSAGETDISPATKMVWRDRLARWRARLGKLARRGVFDGLKPEPSLHASSAFRLHPDYASAFTAMIRMRAGLGAGTSVAPAVPIDRTYSLYEMWCYIGVLRAAAKAFPSVRSFVSKLLVGLESPNSLGAVLAQGDSSQFFLCDGISLTYQRRYTVLLGHDKSRTLVVDAIPDITISRTDSSGKCIGVVIIDPKYRTGSSLADGIRDLHVYRDSIVSEDNRRLVVSAIALSPRPGNLKADVSNLPIDAPAALEARPGRAPSFFGSLLENAIDALS